MLGVIGSKWLEDRCTLITFLVLTMNILDALLTHSWMGLGVIEEANPLMAYLLEVSPPLFFVVKIVLVTLGGFLLWRHRSRGTAQAALIFLCSVYVWIMWLHFDVWRMVEQYGIG